MTGITIFGKEGARLYTQEEFANDCRRLFSETDGNSVDIPGRGTVLLYDPPLIGCAAASDEIFERYKQPEIIGAGYYGPSEWLEPVWAQ